MSDYVLDASALLALLNEEDGAGLVQEVLPHAVVSAVNLAEVVTRLVAIGMPEREIRDGLTLLGLKIIPFEEEGAFVSGFLYAKTKPLGLSLGDRACLGLAKTRGATALTADRTWQDLNIGVKVKLIR
jgi:PIN domain nuclease of toxin-antitoxin system